MCAAWSELRRVVAPTIGHGRLNQYFADLDEHLAALGILNFFSSSELADNDPRMDFDPSSELIDSGARVQRSDPSDEGVELPLGHEMIASEIVGRHLAFGRLANGRRALAGDVVINPLRMTIVNVPEFMEQREPEGINPIEPNREGDYRGIRIQPESRPVDTGPWKMLDHHEPDAEFRKQAEGSAETSCSLVVNRSSSSISCPNLSSL